MADEDRAWNTEDITLSEIEDLNARKRGLKDGYSGYIAKNREIKDILNGFMTQALLEKPENVFEVRCCHGVQCVQMLLNTAWSTSPVFFLFFPSF